MHEPGHSVSLSVQRAFHQTAACDVAIGQTRLQTRVYQKKLFFSDVAVGWQKIAVGVKTNSKTKIFKFCCGLMPTFRCFYGYDPKFEKIALSQKLQMVQSSNMRQKLQNNNVPTSLNTF